MPLGWIWAPELAFPACSPPSCIPVRSRWSRRGGSASISCIARLWCLASRIIRESCAPLGKLLGVGARFATPATRWILPKGRNAQSELEAARSSWQGVFRLEPSITDAEARIIVAEQVRPTERGKRAR